MPNIPEKFVGLIGLGYWGKNLLRNLYELEVLHTACDSDGSILEERKAKFAGVRYTSSFDETLENPEIRAVAIATPVSTHYDYAKRALLAGKDVFVEKPLALNISEGAELVELAKREKRVLMVGHILQYHPAIIRLKSLIASGELGKIQYLYSNRLNIGKLRTEEDILWSFAPHDISVILMLLGEEPVKVSALRGDYINNGICDVTLTTMEFRNGVKGHIFVSWLHPFKEQKLIVVGSKAMAVFDDLSKEKLFLYPHSIEWKDGKIPIAQKADYLVIPVEQREPLKEELSHFVQCVTERKKPRTDGGEGLRILTILERAGEISPANGDALRKNHGTKHFVHESAFIGEGARIGEGTKIWHCSHISQGARIGAQCVIGQNVFVGQDVAVGDLCKIQNNVSLYKGVYLEDEVFCGPSCVFTNVYNPRAFIERKNEFLHTLVKKGATIGANATVVCGVTIGRYAMVGAGAVVKSSVTDHAVVVGVPAKQIGWACKCGTTLRFRDSRCTCSYCGNEYLLEHDHITMLSGGDVL